MKKFKFRIERYDLKGNWMSIRHVLVRCDDARDALLLRVPALKPDNVESLVGNLTSLSRAEGHTSRSRYLCCSEY